MLVVPSCKRGINSDPMESLHIICVLLWLTLSIAPFDGAQGSVHQYSVEEFKASQNGFLFYGGSEGMHASTSTDVNAGGIANGRSYIRFDTIKFRRPALSAHEHVDDGSSRGLIQAIVFDASDRDKVGHSDAICCTSDLAKSEGCKEGEVIIRSSSIEPNWPFTISVNFDTEMREAVMPTENVNISKTGFYSVFFAFCDPQLKGLTIEGATIWKNPTGYLPGSMAPLLGFFGIMSLAYILLGFVWFLHALWLWKNMSKLQNQITVIIALGMLEMTLWYFDYANFNTTGQRPVGITFWAVTFGALKKTLSRLLLLGVSLGYGIVRPTLGAQTTKAGSLAVTYFVAAEVLDMCENVGAINDLSGKTKLLLVLPVAVLDAFFILWIFVSLSRTLEKVEAQKWLVKLELFRKLTNTLAVFVMIAVAWIGYEFYFKSSDPFGEEWQKAWIISAFWSVLTFGLLCVLCILLAPSSNLAKFDYTDETAKDFDEEEALPLNLVVVEPEKIASKIERKERKALTSSGFILDDNSEEDKRE
ncbi:hypothetical protein GOP47_0017966 [Adiantum capillus-veneris]|uniref:GOST seven transmembrane domain-containing protein n=1 Tax=Adiantum capillus-veneris TaxID=13818 RepID=A0A9D4UGD5_ADICA|nr:hypothetical protein GOP47_0017966 [Adiantum capillus-veneris]